jgi:hypothetical protein
MPLLLKPKKKDVVVSGNNCEKLVSGRKEILGLQIMTPDCFFVSLIFHNKHAVEM